MCCEMASLRYTAEEVSLRIKTIILDIPGNGDESDDENVVGGERDIVLTDNETDSEDNSEELFEPPHPSTFVEGGVA